MKKEGGIFDVTMGAYDGAEVCELVGSFILSLLGTKYNAKDIGLYRDDGLAVFKNISGPQAEKIKKDFQKVFKDNGLDIVIKCNMKIVDYLDVTLNLNDGSYRPFRKPNDETNYIHAESNHPPSIIKQLPISVEKRLSCLSSSKEIFDQTAPYYKEALKKNGHKYNLTYQPPVETNQNGRRRSRNIIWFNPPFSKTVSTNIGRYFLNLIAKHFPPHHKYRKIFNKNNIKISYSCMTNMKTIINSHNRKILSDVSTQNSRLCNCPQKKDCPLNGFCLTENTLYLATISSDLQNYSYRNYKGICKPPFKRRYANHKKSFNIRKYKNDTELSKEFWKLKEKNANPKVSWKIVNQFTAYNPNSKRCNLCLNEKLEIAQHEDGKLLNKKTEVISKCRHQNKYRLGNLGKDNTYENIT